MFAKPVVVALSVLAAAAALPSRAQQPASPAHGATAIEQGIAAVYSDRLDGRKTASGQRYDRNRLTAAHKTLPFGTFVKVTNVKNGKSVVVRINDRGPVQAGRIVDLSPRAAQAIGVPTRGLGEVRLQKANSVSLTKE